jgi:hypothetical protein
MPRVRTLPSLLGAALLLNVGCAGLTGACTYRVRSAQARGSAPVQGGTVVADVLFYQNTDAAVPSAVQFALGSSPLPEGRITLELVDSRRPAEVLVHTEATPAELAGNRQHIVPLAAGRAADAIFDAIASGTAVLRIGAGGGTVFGVLQLTPQRVDGWTRPRCD